MADSSIPTPFVGHEEFKYTAQDLALLRDCIIENARLSASLQVFAATKVPPPSERALLMMWLDFAEAIKQDFRFPEKHMARLQAKAGIQLVKAP